LNLNIVLVNPEIPQNTGNVARTCAALGATLHLVEPLGFSLEDRYLRRAGLDYWHLLEVRVHAGLGEVLGRCDRASRFFASAHATEEYTRISYPDPCYLFFGPESKGLPGALLNGDEGQAVLIPVREGARSLNLSNAVAVVAYEVHRQNRFEGLGRSGLPPESGRNNSGGEVMR